MRVVATGRPDGSSPHVRGTPRRCSQAGRVARFIPACAGNAFGRAGKTRPAAVHPRMRGERLDALMSISLQAGSSPHARGTRPHRLLLPHRGRFIPACAGNAGCRRRPRIGGSVHPRMRGERISADSSPMLIDGSSPHTRGTQGTGDAAHSGQPVHPRIRRERVYPDIFRVYPDGSSPHTRGTRPPQPRVVHAGRFIPAYAGNAAVPRPE